tara:strand:- start:923 stop:1126 length:204 start_codon:yes stop_codon:yes gene_type:complete
MNFDIREQFTPRKRAYLLLNKYPLDYVKMTINGFIKQYRKMDEIYLLDYWNDVAIEVKEIITKKEDK